MVSSLHHSRLSARRGCVSALWPKSETRNTESAGRTNLSGGGRRTFVSSVKYIIQLDDYLGRITKNVLRPI